jgi:hypothetical protein
MKGKIIIEQGVLPEDLPEGADIMAVMIHGDAELNDTERFMVMYHLAQALDFTEVDWEILRAMVAHEPPFDEMIAEGYSIGMTGWVKDDGSGTEF